MSRISRPDELTGQFLPPRPLSAEEEQRLRRRRSSALGLSLGALALIFFLVTIVKMGAQVMLHSL